MVIDARPRFARRTAEACLRLWTRDETIAAVKRLGADHEPEIVKQIEQIELERLQELEDE